MQTNEYTYSKKYKIKKKIKNKKQPSSQYFLTYIPNFS